jgi:two-component sensor histidine kinase
MASGYGAQGVEALIENFQMRLPGIASYFRGVPIRFPVVMGIALLLATLFLVQAYLGHLVYADIRDMGEFRWWHQAPVPYLNFLFWALLCPLVYGAVQRWPLSMRPYWHHALAHLGLGVVIGVLHELVTSSIYYAILFQVGDLKLNDEFRQIALNALPPAILQRFMEYWTLVVVLVAVDNARQVREKHTQLLMLRNELHVSRLNALKNQLQPHFLFNTLNTVSALMDQDVDAAHKVLSRLGGLLRSTLNKERKNIVSLQDELDYIGNYLGIQSVRYRDRLHVEYDIPRDCTTAMVPGMMLQPLVENAVKHGIDRTSERVVITVSARMVHDSLTICVADNGKGCPDVAFAMANGGIGLCNVRDRLQLLYGEAARFEASSTHGKGFSITLSLPMEFQPAIV